MAGGAEGEQKNNGSVGRMGSAAALTPSMKRPEEAIRHTVNVESLRRIATRCQAGGHRKPGKPRSVL